MPTTTLDSTKALVSLAEAKEFMKVTTSNNDAIISHLINAVSAWVAGYLKRNLVATDYVEYYSGDGSQELMLRNFPVNSVASIYIDSLRQWASSNLVDATDMIIKKDRGIIKTFNLLYGWAFGESNIKVSYNAGYTIGTNGSTGTMPYDIRMAVKRLIERSYQIGYTHGKMDFQSESISGMNVTFNSNDIPKDVISMLDGWKSPLITPQYQYADDPVATPSPLASASGTFTNADLVANILTVTHYLNLTSPFSIQVVIFDETSHLVVPDSVLGLTNSFKVDLSSYVPLSGTWGYVYAS